MNRYDASGHANKTCENHPAVGYNLEGYYNTTLHAFARFLGVNFVKFDLRESGNVRPDPTPKWVRLRLLNVRLSQENGAA